MTLALTLGMTIGVRRTLWMMLGELAGVASVVLATCAGAAVILIKYPDIFVAFKLAGGIYLIFLGMQLWRSSGALAITQDADLTKSIGRTQLVIQGFATAIVNPKGWAFFAALLPPFIDYHKPVISQITILLILILILEFTCLVAYASGGCLLRSLLQKEANVQILNRIAGSFMIGVAVWLAVS